MKPVKVTSVDGTTVYWQFDDTREIKLGSVVTDQYTRLPKNFSEGKTYILIYCDTHKTAYEFVPVH